MPFIVYDPNHPLKQFKQWARSGGDEYKNRPDVVEITDMGIVLQVDALVGSVPAKYLKIVGTTLTEYTELEKANQDGQEASEAYQAEQDAMRTSGPIWIDQRLTEAAVLRALVLLMIDEINFLRQWITSFKSATAAATSLANLQSRVAELANLPDRKGTQARDAIKAKLAAGEADA